MAEQHVPIEETTLYKTFEEVADDVWSLVDAWPQFAKNAMGRQLVSAADSVTANLADGDGRYGSYDAIHFFVIARGSARETKDRLKRASKRGLAPALLIAKCDRGLRELNAFISYRRRVAKPSTVRDERVEYIADEPSQHLTLNT